MPIYKATCIECAMVLQAYDAQQVKGMPCYSALGKLVTDSSCGGEACFDQTLR